ncbi:MAG TPA: hypothetical protein VNN55_06385 [bacterium]|nr:hypothetical protein [bacterium]
MGLILLPVLVYPRRFGFPALDLNPAVGLLEWAFYIAVFSIATDRMGVSTRVVAAGFTVVTRLLVGAASGCAVGGTHGLPLGQTVPELMWSYPLALIPQVLIAPIVTSPLWEQLMSVRPAPRVARPATVHSTFTAPAAVTASPARASASRVAMAGAGLTHEPSFDDAVSYVGEYSGVRLCWIVDNEGLPLAVWQRQQYTGDADFWAPVSVEMMEFHQRRLSAGGDSCHPDRVEICTDRGRLVVEAVRDLWLGVLTEPDTDELINVRITRAREMIDRHLQAERGRLVAAGEAEYA